MQGRLHCRTAKVFVYGTNSDCLGDWRRHVDVGAALQQLESRLHCSQAQIHWLQPRDTC